jgi:prolipoprotein diacylglyceryltransferase
MSLIRSIFLGVLIGAGVGAKLGGLIGKSFHSVTPWLMVEQGLYYGGVIGCLIAISIYYKRKVDRSAVAES